MVFFESTSFPDGVGGVVVIGIFLSLGIVTS